MGRAKPALEHTRVTGSARNKVDLVNDTLHSRPAIFDGRGQRGVEPMPLKQVGHLAQRARRAQAVTGRVTLISRRGQRAGKLRRRLHSAPPRSAVQGPPRQGSRIGLVGSVPANAVNWLFRQGPSARLRCRTPPRCLSDALILAEQDISARSGNAHRSWLMTDKRHRTQPDRRSARTKSRAGISSSGCKAAAIATSACRRGAASRKSRQGKNRHRTPPNVPQPICNASATK